MVDCIKATVRFKNKKICDAISLLLINYGQYVFEQTESGFESDISIIWDNGIERTEGSYKCSELLFLLAQNYAKCKFNGTVEFNLSIDDSYGQYQYLIVVKKNLCTTKYVSKVDGEGKCVNQENFDRDVFETLDYNIWKKKLQIFGY